MSYAEDTGYDVYWPDEDEFQDEFQKQTNGRIWSDNGEPTCANCDGINIKTSKAGNLYCADLCWVEEEKE